jgi:hypothetical protein
MPTDFSFERVFRAPSVEAVLAAYFDAEHLAAQDKVGDLHDRKVVESKEDAETKHMVWTVRAGTALPVYVRPFVEGGRLVFREQMTWRKRDNEIDMTITPQILGGRVQIAGLYKLAMIGDGQVKRVYKGTITAALTLVGSKVERGILEEITKGMPAMAEVTQTWLAGRSS